jgi:hypothetical protein
MPTSPAEQIALEKGCHYVITSFCKEKGLSQTI